MNRTELKSLLDKANVSEDTYTFEGGLPYSKFCLSENYGKWYVYYSERGSKFDEKLFYSESDACEYMYKVILSDPSTRKR